MTLAGPATTAGATSVTVPVVRALLDEARRKDYKKGVLGIRARPEWAGPSTFTHEGVEVTVTPCISALAVREALLERDPAHWLVVLTDRPDEDLGSGILSHLVGHRLRAPDPWEAARLRFAATAIDPALVTVPDHRDLAVGLLTAAPPAGWPPAPGGVLTREHAMAAVARVHLGFGEPGTDAATVLRWSAEPEAVARIADLRALAGDRLTDAVLSWAAERAGAASAPLLGLLRAGQGTDAVPLGVALEVLARARSSEAGVGEQARIGLVRLEPRTGGPVPEPALAAWSLEAGRVVRDLLDGPVVHRPLADRMLARADELLAGVAAADVAEQSDLLPHGLTRRLGRLADLLAGLRRTPEADADRPLVGAEPLVQVEDAWERVTAHELASSDSRVSPFAAAVRLARWLGLDTTLSRPTLSPLLERQRDVDAWVDSAVNDAAAGVGSPELGAGLTAVLAVTRVRRDEHDRQFATALAVHTVNDPVARDGAHDGVWHLEDLLPSVVLPMARTAPVLLLVLDGMSVGVATEVVAGVLGRRSDGWVEALLPGQTRRAGALAVLPTLTEVSRASLLSGDLRVGGQDVERRGYAELVRAHGLPATELFHKKPLDSSRPGLAVADDVGAAIDDVTGRPLVTCVLNTIDDALDRSDPGGIDWAGDTVKHLSPLLERARNAGRVVVLTADHGHIVERREGAQRPSPGISSGRSRPADPPAGDGEVLVEGRRVLEHGGRAVLAVDERLRYGPLKAGYHGGAAPAEAVVPVIVLVAGGAVPEGLDLRLAPPQEPAWWYSAAVAPVAPASSVAVAATGAALPPPAQKHSDAPTLFDVDEPAAPQPAPVAGGLFVDATAVAVVGSRTYAGQRKIAGRLAVTDEQVTALLTALLTAADHRLAPTAAAAVLSISQLGLRGAVVQLQRLLNVESYPVLRVDSDGATVILDVTLLREQFEIEG